ncbi:MAG: hypothetical protein HC933_22180 [Pleurocapsa sp. SU_196_0]|nr:hypothetical protein [Pleurocapsa sp. SU_196_0]
MTWPPAFAVGQTWGVRYQSGSWTTTFTELDSDGDPRGFTTAGPDRRTAGAFMLENGSAAFYVVNNNENLVCVAARSGLQGNVLSGQAVRFSPPNAQQGQNFGACSFTLQGGTQTTTTGGFNNPPAPPVSSLNWPNFSQVGQTWNVQFTNIGNWTLPLTETDADGPLGRTTGTDRRVGYFEYNQQNNVVILWLDGTTDYYGCVIEQKACRARP